MPMGYGQLGDRGLVKALQTRFSLSPDFTFSMSPEVAAVAALEMPELLFQMGWRRWQRGTTSAGPTAAQNSQIALGNRDTNVNMLILVERIVLSSASATQFSGDAQTAVGSTSLGTGVSGAEFRDSRHSVLSNATAELSTTTTAAPNTATMFQLNVLAGTPFEVPGGPWLLFPGCRIVIQNDTVNQAFAYSWVWRERIIQEQENTP